MSRPVPFVAICPVDGKRCYRSRKEARNAARQTKGSHPNRHHLSSYRCGEYWHVGHLPDAVLAGNADRNTHASRVTIGLARVDDIAITGVDQAIERTSRVRKDCNGCPVAIEAGDQYVRVVWEPTVDDTPGLLELFHVGCFNTEFTHHEETP